MIYYTKLYTRVREIFPSLPSYFSPPPSSPVSSSSHLFFVTTQGGQGFNDSEVASASSMSQPPLLNWEARSPDYDNEGQRRPTPYPVLNRATAPDYDDQGHRRPTPYPNPDNTEN